MKTRVLDKYINAQVKYWQQEQNKLSATSEQKSLRQFITINREYGCLGYSIAQEIVGIMNSVNPAPEPLWAAYERQVLDKVMEEMELSSSLVKTLTDDALKDMTDILTSAFSDLPPQVAVYQKLAQTIRILAGHGNVIIVGRAGNVITRDMSGGYDVPTYRPRRMLSRISWKLPGHSKKDAESLSSRTPRGGKNPLSRNTYGFDVTDPHNYDLMINLGEISPRGAAELIIEGLRVTTAHRNQ